MDNLALQIIDNEVTEGFIVDTDSKAEWAVKKLAEEQKELQRMTMTIDSIIAEYQFKKAQEEKKFEEKTRWLKNQLMNYFENVDGKKASKTQLTYSLPSAKLIKKFGGQDFKRDDETLVKWLEDSNRNELVKIKKSPDWATLKKEVAVLNGSVVTADGEIVNGVQVLDKEDTFDIEF